MSITIAIDCRPLLRRPTGVGIYLAGLLPALASIDRDNRYLLFSSSLRERYNRESLPAFSNSCFRDWYIPVRVLNAAWHFLGSPPLDLLFRESIHITHSPHPLILPARKARTIVTIHDLFFLSHPELVDREMSTHYPALVHKHARKADGIITDSEYSKREIIERLQVDPEKVRIIPLGTRPLAPVISDRPRDSILFVGRIEHRKNIGNLIRAFSRMKEKDAQLRLVGPPGAGSSEFRTMALSSGVKDRIIFAGYMNGLELAAEYARARVFVFPSLCEGFGLPLLEAMQHGVPIAASSATSIPEVAGDAAHYFDPQQPEQIASILDRLWSDETERAALTQAGRRRWPMFSWEETARRTIETYRRVAGQ